MCFICQFIIGFKAKDNLYHDEQTEFFPPIDGFPDAFLF